MTVPVVYPPAPPGARLVTLTKSHFALVDEQDFARVSKHRWYFDGRYAQCTIWIAGAGGRQIHPRLHRFILEAPPGVHVDHRNGDKLDCRRTNLRLTTKAGNNRNVPPQSNNVSGYKGVSWHQKAGKWQARIQATYQDHWLGYFATAEDAARAYNAAARQYFGEHAWLNDVPGC